jgi:hypothetical protein
VKTSSVGMFARWSRPSTVVNAAFAQYDVGSSPIVRSVPGGVRRGVQPAIPRRDGVVLVEAAHVRDLVAQP